MNNVPDRSRVRLPDISSRAYEHPADRSALVALRKLTGFDVILKNLASLFSDRSLRLMFLASSVRASEQQFPHLYQTMLFHLVRLAARLALVPFAWIGLKAVIWGLEEWYRKSELSCDRAGLLA